MGREQKKIVAITFGDTKRKKKKILWHFIMVTFNENKDEIVNIKLMGFCVLTKMEKKNNKQI